MNVAFGLDPANPEHLLRRRRGFVDRIRPLGFERVPAPTLLVYYRSELDSPRRSLYRLQDTIAALSEDARARWLRAGLLVNPYRVPPLA